MTDIFTIIKNGDKLENAINKNNANRILINKKEKLFHGITPYLYACIYGKPETLRILEKHGADPYFRLVRASDHVIYHAPKCKIDTKEYFEQCQEEAKKKQSGLNAVALSIMKDNIDVLVYLHREKKFSLDEKSNGFYPIHIAARQNASKCFEYLKNNMENCDPNLRTGEHSTIGDLVDKNNSTLIKIILKPLKMKPKSKNIDPKTTNFLSGIGYNESEIKRIPEDVLKFGIERKLENFKDLKKQAELVKRTIKIESTQD